MIDYSEITDGILAVVEEETPILLSLPEDVITERLNSLNISDFHNKNNISNTSMIDYWSLFDGNQ